MRWKKRLGRFGDSLNPKGTQHIENTGIFFAQETKRLGVKKWYCKMMVKQEKNLQ